MSGEGAPVPSVENGLLRGSRTKSYGSLFRAQMSPGRQRRIEHQIQPGETLQGLALKYGVSMEQIKRANRMYTNDSIFLKKSLSIPVMSDLDHCSRGMGSEDSEENGAGRAPSQTGLTGNHHEETDMTPEDFLKRLDGLISQSKQAAVKRCQGVEERVAALEAACSSRTSDRRPLTRSQSEVSSSRVQQMPHGAVPLTITRLTKKLRDSEDEIFQL